MLFDSLRTVAPIANAIVTVEGRPERTRTDGRGRFRFIALPVGVWTLRYQAPWLDSLAVPPLTRRVEVFAGAEVPDIVLATPSLDSYQRALCGALLDEDTGILRGVLRDANADPLARVFVGAIWAEARVAANGSTTTLVATIDTTDASGGFALCGVPRYTTFLVRAGAASFGTEELVLTLEGYLARHLELVAGPSDGRGTITGRVTTKQGREVPSPTVSIPGDSVHGARGDAAGRFSLYGLPLRSMQLSLRAIGFLPRYVLVNPAAGAIDLGDVGLDDVAQELSAIRITALATTLDELEFRQRQRVGGGIYLDEATLRRYSVITATVLANHSIAVRSTGGRYPGTLLRRGADTCRPRFFLDGVEWGIPRDGVEEVVIMTNAKRIEVYEAAQMPVHYTDLGGCGVVLVWTR